MWDLQFGLGLRVETTLNRLITVVTCVVLLTCGLLCKVQDVPKKLTIEKDHNL